MTDKRILTYEEKREAALTVAKLAPGYKLSDLEAARVNGALTALLEAIVNIMDELRNKEKEELIHALIAELATIFAGDVVASGKPNQFQTDQRIETHAMIVLERAAFRLPDLAIAMEQTFEKEIRG